MDKKVTGGTKNGSIEDNFNCNIYFSKYCADSYCFDAGRQIRRAWDNQWCSRHILGKEQRTFQRRNAGENYQGIGCSVFDYCSCIEYWKFLSIACQEGICRERFGMRFLRSGRQSIFQICSSRMVAIFHVRDCRFSAVFSLYRNIGEFYGQKIIGKQKENDI